MVKKGNKPMTVRMDEAMRVRFLVAARNAGTDGSALVKAFVLWYLGEGELPEPGGVDGGPVEGG